MRQSESKRLGNHLAGCGGAEELASSAGRRAGAATNLGGILQCDLILSEARADGLDFSGILSRLRQKRHASGNKNGWLLSSRRQSHHHGGQTLVAGGDADDSFAGGQRSHQAAQDNRGVVAKGERVHHAGCALGAAVAGVGAGAGEGDSMQGFQFASCFRHQETDFPVAGVETEGDGLSAVGAQAAVGAEDQKLRIEQAIRVPAHTGILTQAEKIPGGLSEQHLR